MIMYWICVYVIFMVIFGMTKFFIGFFREEETDNEYDATKPWN